MVGCSHEPAGGAVTHSPHRGQRRWLAALVALLVVAGIGLLVAADYAIHHAEPILRKRIVETLSTQFGAPVDLDRVQISLLRGMEVNGYGLRIPFGAELASPPPYALLTVQHFRFRTALRSFFLQPMHVASVEVEGMELHIPPPALRRSITGLRANKERASMAPGPRSAMVVDQLVCHDVNLYIDSGKPGKDPLLFRIASLRLQDVGREQAMRYDAELTNPKPRGVVHAQGHFGPWAAGTPADMQQEVRAPDPGSTPVDGQYTFDHADLNTIHGIGGTLSSAGHFTGVLDRIAIDGETDVPDFSLDISDRPVPLHTSFHALVDGTNGDTYLQPVHARLGGSDFITAGKVVKLKGKGHDIQLTVEIPHGRMQDFLRMAVHTHPPLMQGALHLSATLHIPPGQERVPLKMEMQGTFQMSGVKFNNPRWQDRLDGLSARAQGHPREASEGSHDQQTEVHSELSSRFTMAHGVLAASDVRYVIPGVTVLLNGVYGMDGKLFEFKGHVRTAATASQMVTGWKRLLLKPADHFLQKNGAGLELPIEIFGTQGDLHFGLALHGADDTPAQMLVEVKAKDHEQHQLAEARRLATQAEAEDRAASAAATLQAAEQAHHAAVRHRAEASRLLDAMKVPLSASH